MFALIMLYNGLKKKKGAMEIFDAPFELKNFKKYEKNGWFQVLNYEK